MSLEPQWYVDLLKERDIFFPTRIGAALTNGLQEVFEPRAQNIRDVISRGFDKPIVLNKFLSIHAESERSGAEIIRKIAYSPSAEPVRRVMLAHAIDEDRHDRMLSGLSDYVLKRSGMKQLRPDHSTDNAQFLAAYGGDLAGFICDTHIAEIRSHYFLDAYVLAAEASSAWYAPKIKKSFRDILLDEKNHISYTGALISRWSKERLDLEAICGASLQLYSELVDKKLEKLLAMVET